MVETPSTIIRPDARFFCFLSVLSTVLPSFLSPSPAVLSGQHPVRCGYSGVFLGFGMIFNSEGGARTCTFLPDRLNRSNEFTMVAKQYIPKGLVTFEPPRREFYRYGSAEMCGPLPKTLYKVLSQQFARRLLDGGEMMWSTLTYFQHVLDATRGDPFEGSLRYFPAEGLKVTRGERNGRAGHAEFTLAAHGNQFMATQSHHIFIYSTTLDSRLAIGDAADRACVEIFEPATFLQHMRRAVERHRKASADRLIHDRVCYWSPENPPSEVWALPHRLTMSKYERYAREQEYRFAFGTRSDVFDFQNVTGLIVPKGYKYQQLKLERQAHRMRLCLGPLADCCRLLDRGQEGGGRKDERQLRRRDDAYRPAQANFITKHSRPHRPAWRPGASAP